jgi:hypothetical protein
MPLARRQALWPLYVECQAIHHERADQGMREAAGAISAVLAGDPVPRVERDWVILGHLGCRTIGGPDWNALQPEPIPCEEWVDALTFDEEIA